MEFDVNNYDCSVDYRPTGATIQLKFTDGSQEYTDTVDVSPEWVATLFKGIRRIGGRSGPHHCLSKGSPELTNLNVHCECRNYSASQYRGWLRDKPSLQEV